MPAPQCVGGWSDWINKDSPDVGDGDHEQMTSSELASFCPGGTVTRVECQTVDGIEHFSSGEILTCTTDGGLQCNNADNFPIPCSDYQIRYECSCPRKSFYSWSHMAVSFFFVCVFYIRDSLTETLVGYFVNVEISLVILHLLIFLSDKKSPWSLFRSRLICHKN